MKKILLYCIVFVIFIFHQFNLSAQDSTDFHTMIPIPPVKSTLNGYVKGLAYVGAKNYDYSNVFGEISLNTSLKHQNLQMRAELRFREGISFGTRITNMEIREAWAGYSSSLVDFKLGNQIIKWGKTDGFNPTNCITPTNYFILTDEPDDQRMSNFVLQGTVKPFSNVSFTAIGIPFFSPSVYRYELFDMGKETRFIPADLPDLNFKNGAYALKTDFRILRADMSISWFDGYNPDYGFITDTFSLFPQPEIIYRPAFFRKRAVGADFALPLGRTIIRAEAAYNITKDYEKNMHIPFPGLSYVAGIEREIAGVTTIMQYVGGYTPGYKPLTEPPLPDPLNPVSQIKYARDKIYYESELFNRQIFFQQEKFNHAVFLALTKTMLFETLKADLSGYYNITSEEYFARGSLTWSVSDNLRISLGGILLNGPEKTIFSHAGKVLSGGFLGLRAMF